MVRFIRTGKMFLNGYISNGVTIPESMYKNFWKLKSHNFLNINNFIRIKNGDYTKDNETEYYPMKVFKK